MTVEKFARGLGGNGSRPPSVNERLISKRIIRCSGHVTRVFREAGVFVARLESLEPDHSVPFFLQASIDAVDDASKLTEDALLDAEFFESNPASMTVSIVDRPIPSEEQLAAAVERAIESNSLLEE